MLQTKVVEKIKTHFVFSNPSPLPQHKKNLDVYEIMWKNIVEQGRPQMTIQYGACAVHAGYLRLQTHTQNM